ncbi:hypothetical protein [Amycolatopsis dongchuanensis]|uniref:Uncharacterized protein n=1 Tax=Amycolatopsis dongchuanensis TaxID=1070866 RepID=A0ABP8VVS8_9PSEU
MTTYNVPPGELASVRPGEPYPQEKIVAYAQELKALGSASALDRWWLLNAAVDVALNHMEELRSALNHPMRGGYDAAS